MELNGALSNPFASDKRLLRRLNQLRREVVEAASQAPIQPDRRLDHVYSEQKPRAGAIQDAVIEALAAAAAPLRAREVHSAAEEIAKKPLSWSTVKDCLHKNARRPDSPIQRVSHGRYQYRAPDHERDADSISSAHELL